MKFFALSVSDLLPPSEAEKRVDSIVTATDGLCTLAGICVRDDASNPMKFAKTAEIAKNTGMTTILESGSVESLKCADGNSVVISDLPPETLACAVPRSATITVGGNPDILEKSVALARKSGFEKIILRPPTENMKSCLENTVTAGRLFDLPIMCKAWSGEYALALAVVCFLNGGSVAVLDDLDPYSCSILDSIVGNLSDCGFR